MSGDTTRKGGITQVFKQRLEPMFAGLAWSVPAAMWTGFVAGEMPADTPGLGLSLLLPTLACVILMLLLEQRLTWPGRIAATTIGVAPVASMVLFGALGGSATDMVLAFAVPLSWVVVAISLATGHTPVIRALAHRPLAVRLTPLAIWTVAVTVWVIVQASPDSVLAVDGGVLEVQMLTIAGLSALTVVLVSAVADRIAPLRYRTTGARRLR
ncbi:MAG: hypothetical protein JXE06_07225 [Coriobacteriia bacterium]|nr:hypothetical protein [Coriobacteriia bacterium]MBN2823168.1 hypothetical protein [Coriobacteriia bacterium]